MQVVLSSDWISFFIVGFGTLFLLGEILVNMRGIFAILGIASIVSYFYMFLQEPASFIALIVIYFISLMLIIVDGKLLNDGTLGILGLIGMAFSVVIAAPNFFAGLYALIGVIIGGACSFLLLKLFPRRNMWKKIMLKDRLTTEAGYTSLNEEYKSLVGKEAITKTDLRPVGTIVIDDKEYSAISDATWIKKGTVVIITEVDGTKILVKEIE